MTKMLRKAALVLLAAAFSISPGWQAPPAARIHMEDCFNSELQETIRCGWMLVPENRQMGRGREIKVKFVILPAKGPSPRPDPIIIFAGGPGAGAATGVVRWAVQFEKFRTDRDIILVDQRGTGESNPLPCRPIGDPDRVQTWLGDMYTQEYIESCRRTLQQTADLRFYHTSFFLDDVDELRRALGYGQINVVGGSYGSRVAFAYLQRYPGSVRSAFLWSCNTTDMRYPTFLAPDTQASLERLFDDCQADPAGAVDYPDLRQEFEAVLTRLRQGSVEVPLTNPFTGSAETVSLGYYPFVAGLRSLLYSDGLRKWVPLMIYWAARGEFAPIAEYTAEYMRDTNETLMDGLYLSVTCPEDTNRMDVEEARALAAGTFMETFRIDQQKLACDLWPEGAVRSSFFLPYSVDVPALIVSGEVDPVTPPKYGTVLASFLPASLHVIVPNTAHGMSASTPWWKDCFDDVALDFMTRATTAGLDTSCVQDYPPPTFYSWRDFSAAARIFFDMSPAF